MKKHKEILKNLNINKKWTLFLDRDGVINKKIDNDYVRNWEQFKFIEGSIEGLKILREIFGKIIIITNQRGVGRKLMTEQDLINIHENMKKVLEENGIIIDGIYYCIHDHETEHCECRKPKIGLALKALYYIPSIDFTKSVVCGDSLIDINFGRKINALTVHINEKVEDCVNNNCVADLCFKSLLDFALLLKEIYQSHVLMKG